LDSNRANGLLRENNRSVKGLPTPQRFKSPTTHEDDLLGPYVDDLTAVIDLDPIRSARIKIGVDPLGGAARSPIGKELPSVTNSISPSSTTRSIRHFAS